MQIGNFVQMTYDDAFKQNECEGEYSYLKRGKLLNTFLKESAISADTITKFCCTYVRLHYNQMDQLITWVHEQRRQNGN